MSRKLFLNLAVHDLDKSTAFFAELGFSFEPRFTNRDATCVIVNEHAYVLLLAEKRFKDFTKKALVDSTASAEAIIALSVDSRQHVDDMVKKALAAGATPANDPQDHGFMYGWRFQDLDGHLWETFWMDPNHSARPA
ncbi:VOC family protein [Pendulispora albinea]|uniref:Glyoxalase/bleomycin resistance/extradiol dioxygenase family protein n=1 Tax=Pendulispora albinea TaxID=2741071 RepID=A0ABZ2LRK2_9BACT